MWFLESSASKGSLCAVIPYIIWSIIGLFLQLVIGPSVIETIICLTLQFVIGPSFRSVTAAYIRIAPVYFRAVSRFVIYPYSWSVSNVYVSSARFVCSIQLPGCPLCLWSVRRFA